MSQYDETLTPAPPCGGSSGVGQSPYPLGQTEVAPPAPSAKDGTGHVGSWPFGGWHTEPHPQVDDHSNRDFDCHRGSGLYADPKPGSF